MRIINTRSNRLYDLRKQAGLNQSVISQFMSISQVYYSRMQAGSVEPSLNRYWQLADLYNVSIDYICGNVDNPSQDVDAQFRWFPATDLQLRQYTTATVKTLNESRQHRMAHRTRMVQLRKMRNMTQADMAKKLGISTSNYGRYETGIREPDITMIVSIADIFDVSIDFLVCRCDTPYYVKATPSAQAQQAMQETPPASKPVVSVEFPWMPKTEPEFRAYIMRLIMEQNGEVQTEE